MKKKNKLVKRVIALGLVAILLAVGYVFIFGRKTDTVTKIVLPEIPIISYFGITGETTTEADIIVVERDLNNTIMTNGYAVKLFLAPEDRYENMINTANDVIKQISEDATLGYKFDYATSTFSVVEGGAADSIRYDQDVVMEKLEAGENIYPNTLSLDVVLYTDYDEYYTAAKEGKLVCLDAALNNAEGEMISLNKCIPAEFLNAVKVGASETDQKVYGIPTVRAVGQYEFLVFDQQMLDHYSEVLVSSEEGKAEHEFGFSKNQMKYLDELETYLRYVKNNPGPGGEEITPLLNTPSTFTVYSSNVEYSLEMLDGNALFAFVDTQNKEQLSSPFVDYLYFPEYCNTITKYRSLGYIADVVESPEDEDEYRAWLDNRLVNDKYAVAFYTGTMGDMNNVIKAAAGEDGTGKELVYNVFSKPIATSREICESIFVVHSAQGLGNADYEDYAINFIRLLNGVNGEVDIKNLLLYGAIGVNYTLNNNNEVILPTTLEGEEGQTYLMDTLYTGHTFHAYPSADKGISEEGLELEKQHNQALAPSVLAGFSLAIKEDSVTDYSGKFVSVQGVDYYQVMCDVVEEFYDDYMSGVMFAVPATDPEYIEEHEADIKKTINADVEKDYVTSLENEKRAELYEEVMLDEEKYREQAIEDGETEFKNMTIQAMADEYKAAHPEADMNTYQFTEEEITAAVDGYKYYDEGDKEDCIEAAFEKIIEDQVKAGIKDYKATPEYAEKVAKYLESDKFAEEVEARYAKDPGVYISAFVKSAIAVEMDKFTGGDGTGTSGEFVERVEAAFAKANSARKAEIAREYPFIDITDPQLIKFCSTYNEALQLFQNQYYAIKGSPES